MSNHHVPRHPLPTPIRFLLSQLSGPQNQQQPTPTSISDTLAREFYNADRRTTARTGRRPLSPRQYKVLQAVADQRIQRDTLLGTLEPHLLDGDDVIWTLRGLVIRGLVQLQPIGPPRLTRRGRRTLDSPD